VRPGNQCSLMKPSTNAARTPIPFFGPTDRRNAAAPNPAPLQQLNAHLIPMASCVLMKASLRPNGVGSNPQSQTNPPEQTGAPRFAKAYVGRHDGRSPSIGFLSDPTNHGAPHPPDSCEAQASRKFMPPFLRRAHAAVSECSNRFGASRSFSLDCVDTGALPHPSRSHQDSPSDTYFPTEPLDRFPSPSPTTQLPVNSGRPRTPTLTPCRVILNRPKIPILSESGCISGNK